MVFEEEPFYETSKYVQGFIKHLKEIGVEKITFRAGMQREELAGLVDILGMTPKAVKKSGGFERLFFLKHVRNITFGKIGYKDEKKKETAEGISAAARENFQNGVYFLKKVSEHIEEDKVMDVKAARRLVNSLISNLLENKYSLLTLASVKTHDEYSFIHSINVAILTILQAASFGFEHEVLNDIGIAALLHDVGKLSVGGDVLRKKEKLSEDDYRQIYAHASDGAKILLEIADTNPLAAIAAFEHHLRYDMTGYPRKLFGDRISLVSMMVTISDFYDATRSKRAYREEMACERVYEEMMQLSGEYFHPALLNNFFRIVGVYSPGTLIVLDNKAIGIVVKESVLDVKRPQVEILYNEAGEKEKNPYIINLQEKDAKTSEYKWTIVKSLTPSEKFKIPEKYL
jgi:HD-GYP domain-containing protein (c-di-GMP phosphodiesterase class II)